MTGWLVALALYFLGVKVTMDWAHDARLFDRAEEIPDWFWDVMPLFWPILPVIAVYNEWEDKP